ncbi:DUF2835 family protein [Planctobacterium marinum]|uniref:DUF2835 family protein n=1 Tax=Planctobacterium marinum TaxID=1631968 RepID=UPI0030C71BB9
MKSYFFSLNINYLDCENLYLPQLNTCMMTSDSGERVQLPTKNLRPFVTKTGIQGRFRLLVDENNKIKSFEKIA